MCLTDVAENQLPFPKPLDYDPQRYQLLMRWFEVGQDWVPWIDSPMPNRKTDTTNHGFVLMSSDYIGANDRYPEADDAHRKKIVADHKSYQQGLMWTLANHPRVPQKIREMELTGPWRENNVLSPYVESGYQHDDDTRKGEYQAVFRVSLPATQLSRLATKRPKAMS